MSLAQLQDQAANLESTEQRKLIAFLFAQQEKNDAEFRRKLAQKIDDNDPTHWVELDELRKRYAE